MQHDISLVILDVLNHSIQLKHWLIYLNFGVYIFLNNVQMYRNMQVIHMNVNVVLYPLRVMHWLAQEMIHDQHKGQLIVDHIQQTHKLIV